jgi:hypothetical protein
MKIICGLGILPVAVNIFAVGEYSRFGCGFLFRVLLNIGFGCSLEIVAVNTLV